MSETMYNKYELFIPKLSVAVRSMIILFYAAWLGCDKLCWHSILSLSTCVMCKHDMEM
jgi:hypothetical protein